MPTRGTGRGRRRMASLLAALLVGSVLAVVPAAGPAGAAEISICGRDPAVVDAIEVALDDNTFSCLTVDSEELDDIGHLGIRGYSRPVIDPADFAGLDSLTGLHIEDSPSLKALPRGAFSETPDLTYLVLSGNGIRGIEDGAFAGLADLVVLDLGRNALRSLPAYVFASFPYWDGSEFVETDLTGLETLVLEDNLLSELTPAMLDGLSGLVHLQVRGNQITSLDDLTLFSSFGALETFDASWNRIESIAEFVFNPVKSTLRELHLSGNKLSELTRREFYGYSSPTVFAPLSAMEILSLDRNGLETVVSWSFAQLPNLQQLMLGGNELEESDLSKDLFDPLDKLVNLDLSSNPLGEADGELDKDLFDGMAQLYAFDISLQHAGAKFELNLGDTELSSLHEDAFDGYVGLKTLDLAGNELTSLHADVFEDPAGLGGSGDGELNLAGNELTSLPASLFRNLSALGVLNLADNSLSSLHADLFDGLTSLAELNLAGNGLTALPAGLFDGPSPLEILSLRSNELSNADSSFPPQIFSGLDSLAALDLSCNQFRAGSTAEATAFASRFEGPKDSLVWVDLSGGSWGHSTHRNRAKNAVAAKLTAEQHIEATGWSGRCRSLLDDPRLEVRSSEGQVVYDEFNNRWDVYVAAHIDRVTVTLLKFHPHQTVSSPDEPDLDPDYTTAQAGRDADYFYHSNGSNNVVVNLRGGGWHNVGVSVTEPSGLLEYSLDAGLVRVYREPSPLRAACNPGPVSLSTVYSDGTPDGRRLGNHIPGLAKFEGPKREWMTLVWAAPGKRHCVDRTEVWREDGRFQQDRVPGYPTSGSLLHDAVGDLDTSVAELVKAWDGSPWGPRGTEGGWRDRGTRINEVYQYTIRRFGTDGSYSEASTQWIPVLPFYLDQEASWRRLPDLSDPATTTGDINKAPHYMKVEMGGNNGEIGLGSTVALSSEDRQLVNGLYTHTVCVFNYGRMWTCSGGSTGLAGDETVSVAWKGATVEHPDPDDDPATDDAQFNSSGFWEQSVTRFAMACLVETKHTDFSTLADTAFYNGCAAGDFIRASSIRQNSNPAQANQLQALQAPTGVGAVVTGVGTDDVSVRLSWDDMDVSGYQVLRRGPGESELSVLANTGASVTSYADGDVSAGSTYVYAVKASSSEGLSASSDEVSVAVPSSPPPPPPPAPWDPAVAPDDVRATSTDVSVTVRWTLPAQPDEVYVDTMYLEQLDAANEAVKSREIESDPDTSEDSSWTQTVRGLSAGTSYRFGVRLDTEDHGDVYSRTISVTTQADPPVAPEGLSAVWADPDEGDSGVDLSWTIPDQPSWLGAVSFVHVERDRSRGWGDSGIWRKAGEVSWDLHTTSYEFNDPDVSDDRPHRYRIRMHAAGRSFYSNIAVAPGPTQHPAGPLRGFSLFDASDQSLVESLDDQDSIELADPGGGSWAIRADLIDGMSTGSVTLELDGPAEDGSADAGPVTLDAAPFSLFGARQSGGDTLLEGGTLPVGDYTLAATAYSNSRGRGTQIGTLEIDFTITADPDHVTSDVTLDELDEPDPPDPGPLAGLSLIDTSDQSLVGALNDGNTVELADPGGGSWAIRADIAPGETVGSVGFELAGPASHSQTENWSPYAIYGDKRVNGQRRLHGRALPAGDYTLTVTAYQDRRRGGDTLGTMSISFTVSAQ